DRESQSMSDPGKQQNDEREEQKEMEGVWKPIAPALNPVEHASKETFSTWNSSHVSTQLLFRSQAVKKKVAQRVKVILVRDPSLRQTVRKLGCFKGKYLVV